MLLYLGEVWRKLDTSHLNLALDSGQHCPRTWPHIGQTWPNSPKVFELGLKLELALVEARPQEHLCCSTIGQPLYNSGYRQVRHRELSGRGQVRDWRGLLAVRKLS